MELDHLAAKEATKRKAEFKPTRRSLLVDTELVSPGAAPLSPAPNDWGSGVPNKEALRRGPARFEPRGLIANPKKLRPLSPKSHGSRSPSVVCSPHLPHHRSQPPGPA